MQTTYNSRMTQPTQPVQPVQPGRLPHPTAFRTVFTGQQPAAPVAPRPIQPAQPTAPAVTNSTRRRVNDPSVDVQAARQTLRAAGLHLRRLRFSPNGKAELYLSAKGAATFGFSQPDAQGWFRIPDEIAQALLLTFEEALKGRILPGTAEVVGRGRPNTNDYLCIRARWKEEAPVARTAQAQPAGNAPLRTVNVTDVWQTPPFAQAFPPRG